MRVLGSIILIALCLASGVHPLLNNVCRTIDDYATILLNSKNCWYSYNVRSNTVDIANVSGYSLEAYSVKTEDGYVNSLYRIPKGRGADRCDFRQPIYLKHGLAASSEVFVDVGNRSLAFFLAEKCFDVWLGNSRGTVHSKGHVKYTIKDPQYWNFSFHELGIYDESADLNFIKKATGNRTKIIYIGHSMGTTESYVYASVKSQEAAENLMGIISLAPIAFLTNIRSPEKYLAPFWKILRVVLSFLGEYGLFKQHFLEELVSTLACDAFPMIGVCKTVVFSIFGFDYKKILPEDLTSFFSYHLVGGFIKTLLHYAQLVTSKNFQYYDYEEQNLAVYGSPTPPQYDLGKIAVPVHLIHGSRDLFTDDEDISMLYERIKTLKTVTKLDYNHIDFIHAKDLVETLYPDVMKTINNWTKLETIN